MFDTTRRAVQLHPLKLDHYQHKKIYARLDGIEDLGDPLRDVNDTHCRILAEMFCNYNYDYAHGMLAMYILSTVNAEGGT